MTLGRVLVVDDDQAIREALAEVLADEGYEVDTAADGRQGLDRLKAYAGGCIVILDLMMPVMDGKAFLQAKASDPALANVPVVVITAGGGCDAIRTNYAVHDCIHKPLTVPRLLAALAAATTIA